MCMYILYIKLIIVKTHIKCQGKSTFKIKERNSMVKVHNLSVGPRHWTTKIMKFNHVFWANQTTHAPHVFF